MVIILFTLGLFSIYLDAKVRAKFEGQRWQVPVQVYGQLNTLELGDQASLTEIAQSLKINGYQKVRFVSRVGQFSQSAEKLVIFQRPFDFVDGSNYAQQLNIEVVSDIIVGLESKYVLP